MGRDLVNDESVASRLDERYKRSYSMEAPIYDRKRFTGLSGRFLFETLNYQIQELTKPGFILDVATGTGRVAIPLSQKYPNSKVVGLDLTNEMIRQAKIKAEREGTKSLSLIIGNGRKLPFKDNTFTTITCVRFFHLFPFEIQNLFLNEFYRCLKPGGRIIIEYNNPLYNFGLELLRDKKWRRGFRKMLWPWRLLALKRKYQVREIKGVILPLHLKIRQYLPSIYRLYSNMTRHFLYKWFSMFILVVFEK
ncbi:class I SAM-dependent methyltransferase [Candidatus Bathyarchaeota archaeon]|nr:MAG: class I SAM-dependent methyltransferase [Candidatus Bathyarchaeota archaeon]